MSSNPPNEYWQGNIVQMTGTFQNLQGQDTDPTTIVCSVKDPTGAVTTPAVTRQSQGIYTATYDTTNAKPGPYWYSFTGTGTLEAAAPNVFYVKLRPV